MSRIEINLWDAQELRMIGNQLTVGALDTQVHLILPEAIALPEFIWQKEKTEELPEVELQTMICNHPAIMHKIGGGCNAHGCLCQGTRMESDCERVTNDSGI